ncbi:MAG: hypothetical protein ACFFD4_03960 [Candidatus Odinarchaeota archaeon]
MPDPVATFIEWTVLVFSDLLSWYDDQLSGFPFSILSYAMMLVALNAFMEIVFNIFNFIRRIANIIFLPLRTIHVWFHVQAANKIAEKRLGEFGLYASTPIIPRGYFSTGILTTDDYSRINISGEMTVKEAWIIATAPSMGSLFMLAVLAFLTPFLRTGLIGLIIHLYLFVGSAVSLSPSSNDYSLVVHEVLIRSKISPVFFLWSIAAFAIGFSVGLSATYNPILAVIIAVITSAIYLFALVTVVVFMEPQFSRLNIIEDGTSRGVIELERQIEQDFIFADN